jgi:hypothetical protein
MANPSFISALKSDRCIHYLNDFTAPISRAQSFDLSANVPNTVIDELGNSAHAGIVTDPAEITFKISVLDTGTDLIKNITGVDAATWNLGHFANCQTDYMGVVRDNAGNYFRSVYVKNGQVNSLSYSFDANGNATEAYDFVADNLTVFDGFVVTSEFTATASDVGHNYFTLPTAGTETPIPTAANSYFGGTYFLKVTKISGGNTVELIENNDFSYVVASKRINLTAGTLADGDVFKLVFHSAIPATAINPVFPTNKPASVRGRFTPVSIGVGTKTLIPRLQTAGINVSFRRDRITQLGSMKVLFAPSGVPTVNGNLSALMTDLSLRKLLTYGDAGASGTQFGIEQMPAFALEQSMGLETIIKSPVDNTTVLKRITVPDIVTTSGGMPSNVNGNLTETYSWTGKTGQLTIAKN